MLRGFKFFFEVELNQLPKLGQTQQRQLGSFNFFEVEFTLTTK